MHFICIIILIDAFWKFILPKLPYFELLFWQIMLLYFIFNHCSNIEQSACENILLLLRLLCNSEKILLKKFILSVLIVWKHIWFIWAKSYLSINSTVLPDLQARLAILQSHQKSVTFTLNKTILLLTGVVCSGTGSLTKVCLWDWF